MLRVAYYVLDYVLGFWLVLYPKLLRNPDLIFFDRYFYDHFFDGARLGVTMPWSAARLFSFMIPRPDLIIILRPDPDSTYMRKPELPLKELRRQAKRIKKMAEELHNVEWINTSGPVEKSRQDMLESVLALFRKRLG